MMKQFVQIHYKYDIQTPTLSVDCIQVNSVPVAVVLVANRVAGAVGDSISNCTLPSNLFCA
jgi:hypothetical protein